MLTKLSKCAKFTAFLRGHDSMQSGKLAHLEVAKEHASLHSEGPP